jgi:uncharacterized membrane protein YeaQ/YmgE (transglycosylase-associated protein family)
MLVRRRRWLDRASGQRKRRPGGWGMGSLGPTRLISLLLAVAVIAAICGFIASAVARRNKRRARGFFFLGFLCGLMTGAIVGRRHRGLNALGAVARCADLRPPRAWIRRGTGRFAVRRGLWPAQWHRQVSQRLPLGRGPSLGATPAGVVNALTQASAALSLAAFLRSWRESNPVHKTV